MIERHNGDTPPKCDECKKVMVKHLDRGIMCSLPAQQGFTWVCYDCQMWGGRGSYRVGSWPPDHIDISEFRPIKALME